MISTDVTGVVKTTGASVRPHGTGMLLSPRWGPRSVPAGQGGTGCKGHDPPNREG